MDFKIDWDWFKFGGTALSGLVNIATNKGDAFDKIGAYQEAIIDTGASGANLISKKTIGVDLERPIESAAEGAKEAAKVVRDTMEKTAETAGKVFDWMKAMPLILLMLVALMGISMFKK
jgi:hypothetical protein